MVWVPPEKWLILMQIIEQMLSKKVFFHSFDQEFIITMLSKYSVNEASKNKYDVNEKSIWLEHLTPKIKNSLLTNHTC